MDIGCCLCNAPLWRGNGRFCANCLMRVRRYKQKEAAVLYKGGECEECRVSGDINFFDFHHTADKKDKISNFIAANKKWSSIQEELDKCIMLCWFCHRKTHSREQSSKIEARNGQTVIYKTGVTRKNFAPCSICGIIHNGKGRTCRLCCVAERRRSNKKLAIEYKKSECARCEWNADPDGFDFHHTTDKKFNISLHLSLVWTKLKIELDKCDLLCGSCHRKEHAETRDRAFLHAVRSY